MYFTLLITILLNLLLMVASVSEFSAGDNGPANTTRILSRRKRFIVFPDGSSFQLVFCAQNPGFLHLGNTIWFGTTAALAWPLPSDPTLFKELKENSKLYNGQRRQDVKHIYYLDEGGKVIGKVPYTKKLMVNPAFAKRSINENEMPLKVDEKTKEDMHKTHQQNNLLRDLNENSVEFHRQGRKELYEKLETFLEALGWRGRQCVLRILCETGETQKKQGPFMDEIFRATFTLPKGQQFSAEQHKEYDIAHSHTGDCSEMYPNCDFHKPPFHIDAASYSFI